MICGIGIKVIIICYNENDITKGDYDCGVQFTVKNFIIFIRGKQFKQKKV